MRKLANSFDMSLVEAHAKYPMRLSSLTNDEHTERELVRMNEGLLLSVQRRSDVGLKSQISFELFELTTLLI